MKLKIIILMLLCSLSVFSNTVSQVEKEITVIDDTYTSDGSTSEMADMSVKRSQELDKLLNKYYKILIDQSSNAEKEKLRASQRAWISFRDKELDFYNEHLFEIYRGATIAPLLYLGYRETIIEDRVKTLAELIDDKNE
jgi:uncharacterized protein YecT (DUF1311 family)